MTDCTHERAGAISFSSRLGRYALWCPDCGAVAYDDGSKVTLRDIAVVRVPRGGEWTKPKVRRRRRPSPHDRADYHIDDHGALRPGPEPQEEPADG